MMMLQQQHQQQRLARRAAARTPSNAHRRRCCLPPRALPLASTTHPRRLARRCAPPAAAQADAESAEVAAANALSPTPEMEDAVEAFMKRQAELESGAAFARTRDPTQVIGGDLVSEDDALRYCREIVTFLRTLKASRDMTINEAKLVIAIEDPRARERRQLGIEDERGVSRDEMAAALEAVAAGSVPKDRLALKCLYEDMAAWPYLTGVDTESAAAAQAAATGGGSGSGSSGAYAELSDADAPIAKPYILGKDARAGERPQTLADLLPDWVGYGALYGISGIPVLLAGSAILVLFYNSLR